MKKEKLIELGLSEELADKVVELSSEELKGYIPKSRFDEVNGELKQAKEAINTRDTQITQLKKVDPEALQEEIKTLQAKNKADAEKYQTELQDLKLTNAIKLAITDTAQDADLVASLFDKTKLVLDENGNVNGIDEQLTSLKESKAFLFKSAEASLTGATPAEVSNVTPAKNINEMSYDELCVYYGSQE